MDIPEKVKIKGRKNNVSMFFFFFGSSSVDRALSSAFNS
jgi:hypothetical protein